MGLTNYEFGKKASKGPYKGKPRKDIANIKIKKKLPFIIEKTGQPILGVKLAGQTLTYKDGKSNKTISMSLIQKDEDFGGQPSKKKSGTKKTVSGKVVEVMSEAFFCIYVAMRMAGTLDNYIKDKTYLDWDDIQSTEDLNKFAKKYKILPFVESELKSTVFKQYVNVANAFLVDNIWHQRLLAQVKVFFQNHPVPKKGYTLLRADNLPKEQRQH